MIDRVRDTVRDIDRWRERQTDREFLNILTWLLASVVLLLAVFHKLSFVNP